MCVCAARGYPGTFPKKIGIFDLLKKQLNPTGGDYIAPLSVLTKMVKLSRLPRLLESHWLGCDQHKTFE